MPTAHIAIAFLSLTAGILVSGFLYFKQKQIEGKWLRVFLFSLRALGFALLLFVLIAPLITINQKEQHKPIVAVLVDNSSSMLSGSDSLWVKNELEQSLKEGLAELKDVEITYASFDENVHESTPNYQGAATDIAKAITETERLQNQELLSAMVVVSDGIANLGSNPLYVIENSFLPVYTIAVGDSSKQQDLAIARVRAPEFVFVGDEIIAEITVSAENLNGIKGNLILSRGGVKLSNKSVDVVGDAFARNYTFSFKANKAGIYSYDVEIPRIESERNVVNNKYRFFIEVIENRKKVAIIASAPTPDIAALRESLERVDAYDVSFVSTRNDKQLDKETALVISFFGPKSFANKFNRLLSNYNGPLWFVIDPAANRPQLARFLPWMNKQAGQSIQEIKPKLNKNFGLFKLSSATLDFLNRNNQVVIDKSPTAISGSFDHLLWDNQNKGIASYGSVEGKNIALFQFNGLWHMRMNDFVANGSHDHVDEWLQLTTQFLTASGSSSRLKLAYEKRLPIGKDQVVKVSVYDAAYQVSTSAEIKLLLNNEEGAEFDYSLTPNGDDYHTTLNALEPGQYTFLVSAKLGNETLKAKGAFLVVDQKLEDKVTRANYTMLQQMADVSGGKFFTSQEIPLLTQALSAQSSLRPIETVTTKSISLIDLKWLMFSAFALLALEWILRRYFGTI